MSIVKVAEKAGCSFATVSRVINGNKSVSPEMIERVRRVMAEIGYQPPAEENRRGPKNGRRSNGGAHSRVKADMFVMLISAQQMKSLHTSYMLSGLQAGIEEAAAEHGISIAIGSTAEDGRLPPAILNGRADGIFQLDPLLLDNCQDSIRNIPRVYLMTPPLHCGVNGDAVGPDNSAIGRRAAEYLLSRGHKILGVANPYCVWSSASERIPAFMATARLGGATVRLLDDSMLGFPSNTDRSGFADERDGNVGNIIDMIAGSEPRPTGLFIVGDHFTALIQRGLVAQGILPGRDITIVSCNNDRASLSGLEVRPATFDMNCEEIGRRAVQVMMSRLASLELPAMRIYVEPEFVPGASAPHQ